MKVSAESLKNYIAGDFIGKVTKIRITKEELRVALKGKNLKIVKNYINDYYMHNRKEGKDIVLYLDLENGCSLRLGYYTLIKTIDNKKKRTFIFKYKNNEFSVIK